MEQEFRDFLTCGCLAGGGGGARDGPSGRGYLWAALMRRTFGFDVLARPGCGGRLRLIALIEQAVVIAPLNRLAARKRDGAIDHQPG